MLTSPDSIHSGYSVVILPAEDDVFKIGVHEFGGFQAGPKCYIPGFESVSREQIQGLKTLLRNKPKGS